MSLLDGLVSFWDMDETSGMRYDAYGPNHLADNNTVGYVAGKKTMQQTLPQPVRNILRSQTPPNRV